ncbi:hypothetical protein BD309DRAFT_967935, partial [Dichomitus squalens]
MPWQSTSNSESQAAFDVFFANCWGYASSGSFLMKAINAVNVLLGELYPYSQHYWLTTTSSLQSEVTLFWTGGRLSGATILFLLDRYITLAVQILYASPFPSSVETLDYAFWRIPRAFSVFVAFSVLSALQYLPWAAFSALRSYALCPNPQAYRWPVSATVFALSSVSRICGCVNLYRLSIVDDPTCLKRGCTFHRLMRDTPVEVLTRSSLIASDSVVLCVTWFRTFETAKLSLRSLGKKTSASILLLNGRNNLLLQLTESCMLRVLHMVFTITGVAEDATSLLTSVIAVVEEP